MPRFEPFAGWRYDAGALASHHSSLDQVVAPPYDVIDPAERADLAGRSRYNAVLVELPADQHEEGLDRYQVAAGLLDAWKTEGVVVQDRARALYLYRMTFRDEAGAVRSTLGVIGGLGLSGPDEGEGDVLPHEQTMPKPKGDRLYLLRSCRANLSPVWGLSLAAGLGAACQPAGPPAAAAHDDQGVLHELWVLEDPGAIEAITGLVSAAPVVMADGHHRLETALAYRDEVRPAEGPGPHDLVMALVVELSERQLSVGPIHRLLSGLSADLDVAAAFSEAFEVVPAGAAPGAGSTGAELLAAMAEAGAMGLVTGRGAWLLRPTSKTTEAAGDDLDSARLEVARRCLPDHEVTYDAGASQVMAAVASGAAQAGVLLRPASVATIAAMAHQRRLMPPKTTFFRPKPRTGMVFRIL